jgi:carbon-monoxide dehydrogenase small subunit
MLAVQAEGRSIKTIEGLAGAGSSLAWADSNGAGAADGLHPIQQAFMDKHGLQCGFCTPGIVLTAEAFLRDTPSPSHEEIREMLAGNLCRCTGYHFIVEAITEAARVMRRAQ